MQASGETTAGGVSVVDGSRVGVGSMASVGFLAGVLDGAGVGAFAGCVAAGAATVALTGGVRSGEVRGGRGGVGVASSLTGTVGLTDGLVDAGGLITPGGSDPGEWGNSATTVPVTASPLNAKVPTVRR